MKTHRTPWTARTVAVILLSSTLLFSAGCATRGYQRAAATSDTLTTAASDAYATQSQINQATAALTQMVQRPTEDLRPAFTDYRRAVAGLESSVQTLDQRAAQMEQQHQRYLQTWDARTAEILNPQIRDESLRRQQEVTQQFAAARQAYNDTRESFVPLMEDLRDIQRMLSVDLTAAGVNVAANLLPQIRATAEDTNEALGRLAQDFRQFSASLGAETIPAGRVTE